MDGRKQLEEKYTKSDRRAARYPQRKANTRSVTSAAGARRNSNWDESVLTGSEKELEENYTKSDRRVAKYPQRKCNIRSVTSAAAVRQKSNRSASV